MKKINILRFYVMGPCLRRIQFLIMLMVVGLTVACERLEEEGVLSQLAKVMQKNNVEEMTARPAFSEQFDEICLLGAYSSTTFGLEKISKLWAQSERTEAVSSDAGIYLLVKIRNNGEVIVDKVSEVDFYVENDTCSSDGNFTFYQCQKGQSTEVPCLRTGGM